MKKNLLFISFLFTASLCFSQLVQRGSDIDGETAGDRFGRAVAISDDGNTIAIGAPLNDDTGDSSGHVRVYNYDGASWVQMGTDLSGQFADDQAGYSISLSMDGNTIAIGAPFNDNNGGNSGHVRVYSYDGASWTQVGADINGEDAAERSGTTVSLSDNGTRVAIGGPYNADSGVNSGHVRVYEFDGASWNQLGLDINGPAAGNFYGLAISLNGSGNRLAIGAPTNGDNGVQSGHVRIYEYDGADWQQLGNDMNGDAMDSFLGRAVSISSDGTRVAVGGAPDFIGEGIQVLGYTRIYEYSGGSWNQLGADIMGEMLGDISGSAVALSADGGTVVIGAPLNDNENGFSGHFRVYSYQGGNWIQQDQDINGEAGVDFFGYAVGVSADGAVMVSGGPDNDGNGNLSGHVRVYVNSTLSSGDNAFTASLQLFPNPNNGLATITLPSADSNIGVKIHDIQGRMVYENQYQGTDTIIIEASSLTRGVYFVTLTAEGQRGTLKMIIN